MSSFYNTLEFNMTQNINNWNNNSIQFARLLFEIQANIGFSQEQKDNLCMEMDLEWNEILEIFNRAIKEFDKIRETL